MAGPSAAPEGAGTPYWLAATFRGQKEAGRAYKRVQDRLFAAAGCDLSAYRFYLGPTWYVAVVGRQPDGSLDQQLRRELGRGTLTSLDLDIVAALLQRREEATQLGPWFEAHYDVASDDA